MITFESLQDLIDSFPDRWAFFAAVEEKLRESAAEQPEFRYMIPQYDAYGGRIPSPCYYASGTGLEGDPECDGCIFGQAFQRLGVSREALALASGGINMIVELCPDSWSSVQHSQDTGTPWGEAIKFLK